MVDVGIVNGTLALEVKGLHKLLAFKSRIEVPLSAVRAVHPDPSAMHGVWKGLRMPGTHVPGLIVAGTFYSQGRKTFWDVRRAERALVIELEGAKYDRLVVEVDDPIAVARQIDSARPRAETP